MVRYPATLLALVLIGTLAGSAPAQEGIVEDIQYALDNFDADADGRVTREEFRGEPIDFLRLDLDGSGTIDGVDRDRARERVVTPFDESDNNEEPAAGSFGVHRGNHSEGPGEDEGAVREWDEVFLLGGDRLRGEIQIDSFSLQTIYGKVRLPAGRVATLDLEAGPSRVDQIVCVNGDRFSGVAIDAAFEVRLDGRDDPIRIPREKIVRVRMRSRDDEDLQRRHFLEMKNGDRFSARLASERLVLKTLYGEFPLDVERLDRIEMVGSQRPGTVAHLTEGETITGLLVPEILHFEFDILAGIDGADHVEIHHCRIETLYLQEGFIPAETVRTTTTTTTSQTGSRRFDFEVGLEGWTVDGAQTTWFHTAAEAASGAASMECAGQGALAYTNGANASLTSPTIDLGGVGNRALGFYRRYETEESYDFLRVEVSYDGGTNWSELAAYSGVAAWERVELPLAPDAESLKIRFRFQADDSEVRRGAWVDAVEIVDRR